MTIKKSFKVLKDKERVNWKEKTFKSKLSSIALTLLFLLSWQQVSNAKNLSHNPPKVEKATKQIDVSWIREGIKSTKDIEKLRELILDFRERILVDEDIGIDKISFQEKMLVFNSLINQYKLIKQKFKESPNDFIEHLKKSKVDLAVVQALYRILGKYDWPVDWKDIADFHPITDKDMETIALFVFYMKNVQAEKLNLPKPYKIRPELEDWRSENIFYFYYNEENPNEIKDKEDSIVLNLMENLLPTEIRLIFADRKTLCFNDSSRYEYCLDWKLTKEGLNEFYHYAFKIADSLDKLFEITKHPEKFKGTILSK